MLYKNIYISQTYIISVCFSEWKNTGINSHKGLCTGLNFNGPVICLNLNKHADLHSMVFEFYKYISFIMTLTSDISAFILTHFLLNSKYENLCVSSTEKYHKWPNFTRPHVCKNRHFLLDVGSQISGLGQYKLLGKRTWNNTRFDVLSLNKQTSECQEIKVHKANLNC